MQKIAYIFPGQGAQYVGMGKDICEKSAAAKKIFEKADEILGIGLSRICFQGPLEELTRTDICQPAIVTASVACLEAFKEYYSHKPAKDSLLSASFVAGLSLGEYSALVAAGVLSFEDALVLVRKRGQLMDSCARKSAGKMASIIGLDAAKVRQIADKNEVFLANLNCPGQVVISGLAQKIQEAGQDALKAGALKVIPLKVSGAFHSPFMKDASEKLEAELASLSLNKPQTEVVFNVTASPADNPVEIKKNLTNQVASSVLWEDSVRFMIQSGVTAFFEIGPAKVLKGLIKRIDSSVPVSNIENFADVQALTA
jgi:[acyl-carrier-protein] S-malonyltransferase